MPATRVPGHRPRRRRPAASRSRPRPASEARGDEGRARPSRPRRAGRARRSGAGWRRPRPPRLRPPGARPRPSPSSSAAPPTERLARQGRPHAMASRSALDMPSPRDESRKASEARRRSATRLETPAEAVTRPRMPSRQPSRPRAGRAPDHRRRRTSVELGASCRRREQRVESFTGCRRPTKVPTKRSPGSPSSARSRARSSVGGGPVRLQVHAVGNVEDAVDGTPRASSSPRASSLSATNQRRRQSSRPLIRPTGLRARRARSPCSPVHRGR